MLPRAKSPNTDHMLRMEPRLKAKIFNEVKTEPISKEVKQKGKILARN